MNMWNAQKKRRKIGKMGVQNANEVTTFICVNDFNLKTNMETLEQHTFPNIQNVSSLSSQQPQIYKKHGANINNFIK
jgi:hypothetical protein